MFGTSRTTTIVFIFPPTAQCCSRGISYFPPDLLSLNYLNAYHEKSSVLNLTICKSHKFVRVIKLSSLKHEQNVKRIIIQTIISTSSTASYKSQALDKKMTKECERIQEVSTPYSKVSNCSTEVKPFLSTFTRSSMASSVCWSWPISSFQL